MGVICSSVIVGVKIRSSAIVGNSHGGTIPPRTPPESDLRGPRRTQAESAAE